MAPPTGKPPTIRDLVLGIMDNVITIQAACSGNHEVTEATFALQRQARQLMPLAGEAPKTGWTEGLAALIERIERGDAPSAKELDLHLVLLDVAAAKIRNFQAAMAKRATLDLTSGIGSVVGLALGPPPRSPRPAEVRP